MTRTLSHRPAAGSRVLAGALSGRLADQPGRRSVQEGAADKLCPNMVRGIDNVRETRLNKVRRETRLDEIVREARPSKLNLGEGLWRSGETHYSFFSQRLISLLYLYHHRGTYHAAPCLQDGDWCPLCRQGMAFTLEERQRLGIHGLLPPRFKTQDEQVDLCLKNISRYQEDLNKFIYLMGLQVGQGHESAKQHCLTAGVCYMAVRQMCVYCVDVSFDPVIDMLLSG